MTKAKTDVYQAKEASVTSQKKSKGRTPRSPLEYSQVLNRCRTNPLPNFQVLPKHIQFDVQDPEEKILLLLRAHPITNVKWLILSLAGLLVPIMFTYFPAFEVLPGSYQTATVMFWYLVVIGYALESFLTWYFNVYIVTDERIIDYDFYGLMIKRVSKAKIENIEDVTYQMGGLLQNVFHYGSVYMQTAAEKTEFEFENVPRPEIVSRLLNELMLEEEQEKLDGRVR